MGREIVRQESYTSPEKRSRLWHHEDICKILTSDTGTETIKGISLDMSKIKDVHFDPHAFAKMHRLRYLILYASSYEENENKVHGFEGLESEFRNLSYLHWHGYPFRTLLSSIHLKKLVALSMPHSNIEQQVWHGVKDLNKLEKLKYINLSLSKLLTKSPNLLLTPNLESLILEGCTSLFEIHSSVRSLNELVKFDLRDCNTLTRLPNCTNLKSLRSMVLSGCSKLKEFADVPPNLEVLYVSGTAIEIPEFIDCQSRPIILNLEYRSNSKVLSIIEIPEFTDCQSRPIILNLEYCSSLESLRSSSIGWSKSPKYLNVPGWNFRTVIVLGIFQIAQI